MLKIAAVILLLAIACNGYSISDKLIGSYVDRPELINDDTVKMLITYAAKSLGLTQKLTQGTVHIQQVQTQAVAGINYKIDFSIEPAKGAVGRRTQCQVVIFVGLDESKYISQSQCQS